MKDIGTKEGRRRDDMPEFLTTIFDTISGCWLWLLLFSHILSRDSTGLQCLVNADEL